MITEFGIIRHAETTWNATKTIQGQTETPLTEKGIASAREWGKQFANQGWQRILCSDLGRAKRTAELMNETLNLPIHSDARLKEQDWGSWVGRSIKQLRIDEKGEVERQEALGWNFTPGDGESRIVVRDRMLAALHEAAATWPGERILIVAHLSGVKCVVNHIEGLNFGPDLDLAKRAMHRIAYNGNFSILELNIPMQG